MALCPLPVVRAPERRPAALLDKAKQPALLHGRLPSSPVHLAHYSKHRLTGTQDESRSGASVLGHKQVGRRGGTPALS